MKKHTKHLAKLKWTRSNRATVKQLLPKCYAKPDGFRFVAMRRAGETRSPDNWPLKTMYAGESVADTI